MSTQKYKKMAEDLLTMADITIDGDKSWDIQVKNEDFYKRVLGEANLGLGEAYMDGWWDVKNLDEFFYKTLSARLDEKLSLNLKTLWYYTKTRFLNLQKISRAFQVGQEHYDIGNDIYKAMLDKRMVYTCGYWKDATTLDEAQEAKLDLTCRKLNLKPGQKILDIGCGWGSFAKFAAEKYGVQVVGITVSKNQVELGNELCKGLPVEIRLQDYRDVNEKFDHIVSLGMFEHVGFKNYKEFMQITAKNLKDGGLFLLHTIGWSRTIRAGDPWTEKYIFPNGLLPSPEQISKSIERLFVMEDWHNFGADYDKTLMAWSKNFDAGWDKLKENYDERFYRMWKYYLLSFAGMFRVRDGQLWQIVLSKKGVPGGYKSIR